jgi:hypothetical protein
MKATVFGNLPLRSTTNIYSALSMAFGFNVTPLAKNANTTIYILLQQFENTSVAVIRGKKNIHMVSHRGYYT